MKLKNATIRNFRSIDNQKIEFEPSCRILVGINESGKSNVLKALTLLSNEISINKIDIRNDLDESKTSESYVRFNFSLDSNDWDAIQTIVQQTIVKDGINDKFVMYGKNELNLEELLKLHSSVNYLVDLIEEDVSVEFELVNGLIISDEFKKMSATYKYVDQETSESVVLSAGSIVGPLMQFSIPNEYLLEVEVKDIEDILQAAIGQYVFENVPECVYWNYSEKFLLPASVNLANFSAAPDTQIPLKNMFALAEIKDIKTALENAKEKPHGVRNLLLRVARISTEHIKSVWKEYASIEILLEPNGEFVDISIKDKINRYDFASRSDGFKRFISFLLMISSKVKTNDLKDKLILIDEPEVSLHPAGARYLLNELLEIAKKNQVVFSTHSIFMIDREIVGRHIIVTKKDETTSLNQVDESNYQEEEVIYNALGYSVFESLKEKNLIFEGWRDYRLFTIALSKLPAEYKALKAKFNSVGVAYLQGVKDAGKVSVLLELANRSYLILSDDDAPAKEAQKNFKGNKGIWKRYGEILEGENYSTGEDFLGWGIFDEVIEIIKEEKALKIDLLDEEKESKQEKLSTIKKWLHKNGVVKAEAEELIRRIKDYVSDNLKNEHIDTKYYEMLLNVDI